MGENHEKINYHNKKYTKITLLDFIRKTYTIILFVLDQEPRKYTLCWGLAVKTQPHILFGNQW